MIVHILLVAMVLVPAVPAQMSFSGVSWYTMLSYVPCHVKLYFR